MIFFKKRSYKVCFRIFALCRSFDETHAHLLFIALRLGVSGHPYFCLLVRIGFFCILWRLLSQWFSGGEGKILWHCSLYANIWVVWLERYARAQGTTLANCFIVGPSGILCLKMHLHFLRGSCPLSLLCIAFCILFWLKKEEIRTGWVDKTQVKRGSISRQGGVSLCLSRWLGYIETESPCALSPGQYP